jgi:hypothetical protein
MCRNKSLEIDQLDIILEGRMRITDSYGRCHSVERNRSRQSLFSAHYGTRPQIIPSIAAA